MTLNLPAREHIARIPTPIEPLNYLPFSIKAEYKIYIKRDDLTGNVLQGNKIRKLEYFLADSKTKGADTWLTCGGLQSNHCRATARLASITGLKSILFLRGEKQDIPQGNYLLDQLVGAEIKFVSDKEYFHIDAIMEEYSDRLKREGFNPYIIPEGGSSSLGLCGYFNCYGEIKKQLEEMEIGIDYIITAVGSGGTYGGLLAGAKYFRDDIEIIGINVGYTSDYFVDRIFGYLREFNDKYVSGLKIRPSDIHIIDGYVGDGYALSRREELSMILEMANRGGLILDPVYTGKAFFGLLDVLRKRIIPEGSSVLFMHTGGIWGLMSIGDRFVKYNLM